MSRARTAMHLAGALAALLAVLPQVEAQTSTRPANRPAAPQTQPPPQPEAPAAPYETDLLKVSEVMGGLALLQQVCAAPAAESWTERMRALMEAEGRSPAIRDRLAGAYNKGFRAYALMHRDCTPVSREAAARLAREGEALARQIASRYGG